MSESRHDVAILGGGLAGLTLALQLKRQDPDIDVVVLERNPHPVPEAAHKVGESTVEIGARYFADVLGLRDHLETDQLKKFGLRFFFHAGTADDLSEAAELGGERLLDVHSYQIDRGIFENHLGEVVTEHGVTFLDAARCTRVELDADTGHRVHYRRDDQDRVLTAAWVVDAQSRASLLKKQLGLAADNGHHVNAVWFRVSERIDLAEWSDNETWRNRCNRELPRWLSTNHLMGPGYWVWLIPLSSGSTSVGIVADPALHPLEELRTFDGAMAWLHRHQPRCAAAVEEHREKLQDFRFLKRFSHGCEQVFSKDRWALTGEAGVFLDPFYSPGSDFIALSNTYICDLIQKDRAGEKFANLAGLYERVYFSFYESTLKLYRDQYPLFGHARVMTLKTIWDYVYYWAVLAQLYYRDKLTDFTLLARHTGALDRARELNARLQDAFREWAIAEPDAPPPGVFVNQNAMPLLVRLNTELAEPAEGDALDERLRDNFALLEDLAAELAGMAPADIAGMIPVDGEREREEGPVLAGLPEAFQGRVVARSAPSATRG